MNELKVQIEFINYTKDLSCDEQSVFYFEDLTEAIEWYDNYIESYPADEISCSYFKVYNVELMQDIEMIREVEEYAKNKSADELEIACTIIEHGYADKLDNALEFYNDRCYVMHGYSELDAFEEYLEETCYFENVPDHIRNYIDIDAIKRDFKFSGLTIIELSTEAGYRDYLPIYQYLFITY